MAGIEFEGKVKLCVIWGQSPEEGVEPSVYLFNTEAEKEAFILGVSEMDGWMGYNFVEHENFTVDDEGDIVETDGLGNILYPKQSDEEE